MSKLNQALKCSHVFNPIELKNYESQGDDAYLVQLCTECQHMVKIEYRLRKVKDQTGKEHLCDAIGECCSKQELTTISEVFGSGIDSIIEHMKCQNCSMQYILEFQFVEFYNDEDDENGIVTKYVNGVAVHKGKPKIKKLRCENEDCEFYNKSERQGGRFIAVVYYQETHDFEVSDNGIIGDDLTVDEGEDLHMGYIVRDVRCRHCDESFETPEGWETEFPDTLPDDFVTLVKQK